MNRRLIAVSLLLSGLFLSACPPRPPRVPRPPRPHVPRPPFAPRLPHMISEVHQSSQWDALVLPR
jgi:hypothetical protein